MDNKNENTEVINGTNTITQVSNSPAITIVNSDPNIETISVDQNGEVDPISIEYNNYRNDLNNIYTTTKEENSMTSEFIVSNGKCIHTLTIRQLDGSRNVALTKEFDYTESFKNNFLPSMIEDYNKYNSVFDSNIIIGENSLVTLMIKTKENDTLSIKNIDVDLSSKLNDIIYLKNVNNMNLKDSKDLLDTINNRGIGNTWIIILTTLLISMTLVGTIFFTIMSHR